MREEGGRPEKNSLGNLTSFQEALQQSGISENTAYVWQKVARVPEEFSQLNFKPSTYVDERGKEQPMYLMTCDGFSFLAMGF